MCSTSLYTEIVNNTGRIVVFNKLGFSIDIPPGAVGINPVTLSVCCSFKDEFSPPDGYEFVSPVYIVNANPITHFLKNVTLSLQHWAKSNGSDLTFGFSTFHNSYLFEVKHGGNFTPHDGYGRTVTDHFSAFSILRDISSTIGSYLRPSMNHLLYDYVHVLINCYFLIQETSTEHVWFGH